METELKCHQTLIQEITVFTSRWTSFHQLWSSLPSYITVTLQACWVRVCREPKIGSDSVLKELNCPKIWYLFRWFFWRTTWSP